MSATESAFYDILTGLLIVGNLIFMAVAISNYENIWLFITSLILMFIVVGLRRMYNTKWDEQFGDANCVTDEVDNA